MESFMESLNRLKDVHEKEVLGLQSKLLELNSERCREAQRVEELFAKNQQLREQQKVLEENLRALENRLRAGLCDRCKVTQELARKKQLELESAHLQSLQRLCVLTNEVNGLKEENETLKEEVKRLRGPQDRMVPLAREGSPDPPSPPPLPSPGSWKSVPEKPPGGPEEAEEDPPDADKPAGYRTSPGTKISPRASLPEPCTPDVSPQRISNQLHSTVAVVRPGSRACPADCGPARVTPPLTATGSPPSPACEHSALDSFLPASRTSALALEALKRSLQADRLCLLSRPPALRLRGPRPRAPAPAGGPRSPEPPGPKAQHTEAWEEPAGPPGLPSALVGMQDPRLEGALHLLLAQQHLWARARASRPRGAPPPREAPASPAAGSDSDGPGGEVLGAGTAAPLGRWPPPPTGPGSLREKEGAAPRDYSWDKPLDLSDPARGRNSESSGRPRPPSPAAAPTCSPEPAPRAPPAPSPRPALSNGTEGTTETEPEESPLPTEAPPPRPGSPRRQPFLGGTEEPSEARGQRADSDGRDAPAAADREGDPQPLSRAGPGAAAPPGASTASPGGTHGAQADAGSEASPTRSTPGQGPWQDLQHKRKRAPDAEDTACKKPSQGRKSREPLTAAEEPESPPGPEDRSPSPGNGRRET